MADAKIVLSAEDKTKVAFASAKAGLKEVSALAGSMGLSLAALGTAATLGGLATMVKNIANGIDAMNDLKDATGASIENISALEGVAKRTGGNFDTVSTSLIKFNQVLGQTHKPGSDAEKVLKAIGLNAKELRDLDPAEALLKTAVALNGFADDGNKARVEQLLFGKSLKEVAPLLKDLAEQGQLNATVTAQQAQEAENFNKHLFRMQANMGDFGRTLTSEVLPALNTLAQVLTTSDAQGDSLAKTLGTGVKVALQTVAVVGLEVGFVFKAVGTEIGGIAAQLVALSTLDFEAVSTISEAMRADALKARRANDAAIARIMGTDLMDVEAGDAMSRRMRRANAPSIKPPAEVDPKALAEAKRAAEARARELKEEAKLLAELSGVSGDYMEQLTMLQTIRAKGNIGEERYIDLVKELIGKQPAARALMQAQNKDLAEEVALRAAVWAETLKQAQAYERTVDGLAAENQRMRDDIELIGLSAEAQVLVLRQRNDILILTKEQELAVVALADTESGTMSRRQIALAEEIRLLRERGTLIGSKAELEASTKVAAEALETWKTTNQQIADSFTDNLMRGGKSVKQYLQDLFRTTVLRPMLQPVGGAFATMVGGGGVMGQPGASGGGIMGMASNGMSLYGQASNLGTAFMAGYSGTAAVGTGASFAGTVGGGLATDAMGATVLEGAAAAGIETGIGAGMSSALASIPVYGWIALAAIALYSMFSERGGPKQDGRFGASLSSDIGTYDNSLGASLEPSVAGLTNSYNALAKQFGGTAAIAFGMGVSRDPEGESPTFLDISARASDGATIYDSINRNVGRSDEELAKAMEEGVVDTLIGALRVSGLQPKFAEYFQGIAEDADTATKQAAITVASNAQVMYDAFDQLGPAFGYVGDLAVSATASLIEAGGGMQVLSTNLASYFENFYSDQEKRLNVATRISSALAGTGADLSADQVLGMSREDFRGLVEQFAGMGPAGEAAWQALISVNGAFASIVPPTEVLAEVVEDVAEPVETLADALARLRNPLRDVEAIAGNILRLEGEGQGLQVALLRARGDSSGAAALQRTLDIAGLTEAEVALYDYNEGVRAQIRALDAAATSLEQAAAAARAVGQERYGLETRLLGLQGDTTQLRERELAAIDPSNQSLQLMIWSLEDAAAAAQDAGVAFDSGADAQRAVADARNDLMSAYNRERGELQQTIDRHRNYAQTLREARDAMWAGEDSPLDPAARTAEALRQYNKVEAGAMAGDLESIAALQGAGTRYLAALKESSPTKVGFDLGFARVASGLTLVAARSDSLASAAERQLTAMTDQLTVLGLLQSTAERGFAALLQAYLSAVGGASALPAAGGAGSGDDASAAPAGVSTLNAIAASWYARHPDAYKNPAAADVAWWEQRAMEVGVTAAKTDFTWSVASVTGKPLVPISSFEVGTNYVPYDMTARIHEGEAIVPRRYNPAAGGGNNDALLAEIRALRQELRDSSERSITEIKRGSDALQGRQSVPILVEIAE